MRRLFLTASIFLATATSVFAQSSASGLTLSVTDGKSTIAPGDSMIYVLTAGQSTQPSRDVTITLTLPDGVDLISPDNGGTVNGQVVRWTNATLTQNTNRIFTVQARVIATVAGGTVLTAKAEADSVQATDTTTVQSGAAGTKSYAVTITDNAATVRAGGTLNYIVNIKNNSTTAQTDTVTVQGPPTLTMQSATPSPTSVTQGNVTWTNVTFAPGESKAYNVTAIVDSSARNNTAIETRVTVGNATIADFTAVNNSGVSSSSSSRSSSSSSARFSSRAAAVAPLFRMSAGTQEVLPGGTVTYTLFVQNVLLLNMRDTTVTAKFDPAMASVDNAGGGTQGNGEVKWILPPLSPGQTWQATMTLKAGSNLPVGSMITNAATVAGNDVNGTPLGQRVVTVSTRVLGTLPDTGMASDLLFLVLSGMVALLLGVTQKLAKAL